ncbi:copper amine oxidase N-terminal domain-containing protein [Paenibacillus radicis (ex Xue et al. 2023)]|uniref:Copper amine oxidase N-terminal domain-containing protein n=1 Tax=Paenibacillus radicis (ex Xue et al. 2023) TaxID=2972489 RepID=A0ABT1YRC8_9BACL|nr:copper amine oxidase N-terminal domain-containing protein [Paenibacillus radicis (ex Xue et al. 2023)]MCR8635738.1 copper amine oxidase N-terminal domain-containing protein [Paenibacillus radicis (ex Xue et al. 2023)]
MKKLIIGLSIGMMLGSTATAIAATSETVQATFAKFAFKVNGQEKELKTAPLVVDGTSYLPVREVAGLLGYDLKYDDTTRTIDLKNTPERVVNKMTTASKINTAEWTSLTSLSDDYGYQLEFNASNVTILKKADKVYLKLILPKSDVRGEVQLDLLFPENTKVTLNLLDDGGIYIRNTDLKSHGILP